MVTAHRSNCTFITSPQTVAEGGTGVKLAELNNQIRGVSQRLKQTYARLHRELRREAGEDHPPSEDLKELRRLLRRKAALRLIQTRTLAAHPELVDLLAERKVARLRVKVFGGLVSRSASVAGYTTSSLPPLGGLTNQQLRFRLMGQRMRRQEQRKRARRIRHRATLTDGQLQGRLAAAQEQLSRVTLDIERLSASIDTVSSLTDSSLN